MKVLLLGANGQLGRTFVEHGGLAARGELVVATRDGLLADGRRGEIADLTAPASLVALLDRTQPDVIINTAAYTAVDRAETDEPLATRINADAVGELGRWAAAHRALVIHYSTDYVFDGHQPTPYAVDAPTGPLGAYGRSKLAGEQALRDSGAEHLIFRTAWVYAAHGHNFLRTMLRLGSERDELRVVADQHGAPTDTTLIVRGSLAALDHWQRSDAEQRRAGSGTHHLTASGTTTWHGFASAIFAQAEAAGLLSHVPRIVPIATAEFPTPAQRPMWSVLDNSAFQRHFELTLPDWRDGLNDVIAQLTTQHHTPL